MRVHIFKTRQNGFTIVELVSVLVIGGILAAVIMPKMGAGTGFDERGFRDRVVAGLRFAQKSAIASRRTVCASFSSPPARVSFLISTTNGAANCANAEPASGSMLPEVKATGSVSFAALPADIIFDAAGRPGSGAAISISGLPVTLAITIEAETGYVH